MPPFAEMPTPELRKVAYAEAEAFYVDPAQIEDRERITGFAIDESYSPDVDDAISVTHEGDGSTLHVSIADVGTFIQPGSAMRHLAAIRLATIYWDNRVVTPMLPPQVSEDKLSLKHDQERPVITFHIPIEEDGTTGDMHITHDVIVAAALTPAQVRKRLNRERGDGEISSLLLVSRALSEARLREHQKSP